MGPQVRGFEVELEKSLIMHVCKYNKNLQVVILLHEKKAFPVYPGSHVHTGL